PISRRGGRRSSNVTYAPSKADARSATGACELAVAEAVHGVVVHHAGSLHEGVADGGSDEAEAPPLQLAAHCVRLRRLRWHVLQALPAVYLRAPVDEAPQERREAAELLLHRDRGARVVDRGLDLHAVADDAGVREELLDAAGRVARDPGDIEVVERLPVAVALPEDGDPGEPRLRTFQGEHLEEVAVVVRRDAPLLIVIGDVERIRPRPLASYACFRHGSCRSSQVPDFTSG